MSRSAIHPHGCGRDWCGGCGRVGSNGSSPRTWARFRTLTPSHALCRLIPTGVGGAVHAGCFSGMTTVYSHGRGQDQSVLVPFSAGYGSSSRVWAGRIMRNVNGALLLAIAIGFIPTGAGGTVQWRCIYHRSSVHPHGRGRGTPEPQCRGGLKESEVSSCCHGSRHVLR